MTDHCPTAPTENRLRAGKRLFIHGVVLGFSANVVINYAKAFPKVESFAAILGFIALGALTMITWRRFKQTLL